MANFEIVAREDFSDVTYLLEVRHPLMAKAARAGQFVIVMSHEHGERIPLTIADNGDLLGCAPPTLREFAVTDTLPAEADDIIGAVNQPSGWRGGTGKLELLLRDAQGGLHFHAVASGDVKTGPVCWSQSPPDQPLKYYRLSKATAVK